MMMATTVVGITMRKQQGEEGRGGRGEERTVGGETGGEKEGRQGR